MEQITFKKVVSRMGWAFFTLMVMTQIGQTVVLLLMNNFFPEFWGSPYAIWVLSQVPLYLLAFPIYLWMTHRIPNGCTFPESKNLSIKRWLKYLCLAFALMVIGNLISTLLILLSSLLKGSDIANGLAATIDSSSPLATAIFAGVVAPIGEEIMFRYLPYRKLGGFGDKAYILITSFAFALFHGNLYQMVYAFLIGAVLAYCYARTGRLLYCILLHLAINLYGSVLAPWVLSLENNVAMIALSLFLYLMVGLGIAFLIRSRKTVRYWQGNQPLPEKPVRAAFLNPGFLAYTVLVLLIVVLTTFVM